MTVPFVRQGSRGDKHQEATASDVELHTGASRYTVNWPKAQEKGEISHMFQDFHLPRLRRPLLAASLALLTILAAACGPEPRKPVPVNTSIPLPSSTPQVTAVAPKTTTPIVTGVAATHTLQATTVPSSPTNTGTSTSTATPSATPTSTQTPTATPSPTQAVLNYTWTRVGLTGTNLTSMSLLPGGANTVLVAGPGGVWSGSYNYTHWISHTVKLGGAFVEASLAGPQVMYIASHTGCASGLPITNSRSTDGGKTWQEMPNLKAVTIVPANGTEAYAATCSDVQRTTDAGATWTKLPNLKVPSLDPSSMAVSPDGKTIFAAFISEGGSGRILRSTDGGNSATDVTPKVQPKTPDDEPNLLIPSNLTLVTGSEGRPEEAGLYMTSYQGLWFLPEDSDSWRFLNSPLSVGEDTNAYNWLTTLFVDTAYTADYNKPGAIIYTARAKPGEKGLTNLGTFRSTDGGQTWATLGKGLEGKAVNSIVLAPHDPQAKPGMVETLLAATNDGVWAIPLPPPFR